MSEIKKIDNLVKESFIRRILSLIYDWMPFKRVNNGIIQDSKDANGNQTLYTTNDGEIALGKYNVSDVNTILSIGIGNSKKRKNAIHISDIGEIFIINDLKKNSIESLQSIIRKAGVAFCTSINDLSSFCNLDNNGKLLYLTSKCCDDSKTYEPGLYLVGKNQNNQPNVFSIASTISNDLSNYYTKDEVDLIVQKAILGEIDLSNYYTISDIDNKLTPIEEKIEVFDTFIKNPISSEEINTIINKTK